MTDERYEVAREPNDDIMDRSLKQYVALEEIAKIRERWHLPKKGTG